MEPAKPVLMNGWSASTLMAGIGTIDQDCLKQIKQELPDDPQELAKLNEVTVLFWKNHGFR